MCIKAKTNICVFLAATVLISIVSSSNTHLYSHEPKNLQSRVEEFVHARYFHGVPYFEAKKLDIKALPILKAMLEDTLQVEYWPTIIMTIGFIGEDSTVDILVDFIENRFEGEVSVNQFGALLTVNCALGHIASGGSERALEYLAKACYVKRWLAKELKWYYGNYSGEKLAILLAKIGVNGLSFSGTDRAKEILNDLQKNPESAKSAIDLKYNIEEGLVRIRRLQEEGTMNFFGGQ
jgi:hypothetical protein